MANKTTVSSQNDKKLITVGFITIGILFLIYSRFENPGLTPDAISSVERLSVMFYILIIISFGVIGIGLRRYQKRKAIEPSSNPLTIICSMTVNLKAKKVFIITFIIYGIFFSLTSGILVYQPEVIFSYHYGADVPSAHITPCCGAPGYMPKLVAYFTEHIGIQIIPLNLVLQMTVSYLVAMNTALAVNAVSISKKTGGLGGIGATTGLFIACPTCVGSFLSLFVGATSAIAFTIAVSELQTLFIAITIPILLLTPFILARRISNATNDKYEIN
jgi:hypothetical protein